MNRIILAASVLLIAACGSDPDVVPNPDAGSGGDASGSSGTGGDDAATGPASSVSSTGSGDSGSTGSGDNTASCPQSSDALTPGVHELTIDFSGTERSFEVQVPATYDNQSAVPLVLDLHGLGGSNTQQGSASGFAELAEQEGFIVLRPQGTGILASWNGGDRCCGNAQRNDVDDVGLMRAIVDQVHDALCIDSKRVYVTGHSNGGALTHRLACEAADVFAAVAPVSHPIDFDPMDQCQPSRAIPVMHSHGTSDFIVPYDGGLTAASTPESFAHWASVNGCTGDPTITFEQGTSRCETYDACEAGVAVSLCTLAGGHMLYNNNDDVPIAELSWAFLSAHQLP